MDMTVLLLTRATMVLLALDTISTQFAVVLGGVGSEANPLVRAAFAASPWAWILWFALRLLGLYAISGQARRFPRFSAALWVSAAVLLLTDINNLMFLARL